MPTFTRSDLFEAEFRKLIEAEIERLQEEIALGTLKSYEEYRSATGKVSGLRSSLDYIEEAAEIVSKKLM